MIGGTENGGHPWNGEVMTMRVEDRDNPINAAFGGKDFEIADQAFQLQEQFLRMGPDGRYLRAADSAPTLPRTEGTDAHAGAYLPISRPAR